VYIVIENSDEEPAGGGLFPETYTSFESARAVVIAKYKDELNHQTEEANGYPLASEVNVPESKTGLTMLYIEKGYNFYIHKLPIKTSGGSRKNKSRKNKLSNF
jgi:hypothetical protein